MPEPAVYFDGQSSKRRDVTLRFADRLEIADPGGAALAAWSYTAIRRADGPEGTLRLACTEAPPLARLELRDPEQWTRIARLCHALDGKGSAGSVPPARIALASLAAAVAIFGMVWYGMPLLADRLTAVLPYSWERPLGNAFDPTVRAMLGDACEGGEGEAALRKLVDRLQTAAQLPIAPDPVVLKSKIPNAFALPGGRVYVTSSLLATSHDPDEIAGVLGHEMGHVMNRDGLRHLIREGGTSFLVGMMFGDVTGAGAVLMAGRALLSAAYSRTDEAAADAFAVYVMHSLGRPTAPLGALLQRITIPAEGAIPSILHDHPLTADRKTMLDAENRPATGPDLLDKTEWQALKDICEK